MRGRWADLAFDTLANFSRSELPFSARKLSHRSAIFACV